MSDNSKLSSRIWKRAVWSFALWVASVPVFVLVDQSIPVVPRLMFASIGVVLLIAGVTCQIVENSQK